MEIKIKPVLDPGFVPAALWSRQYQEKVKASRDSVDLVIALLTPDQGCSIINTQILAYTNGTEKKTYQYIERMLKFLLWQRGASKVLIAGCDELVSKLSEAYSPEGDRAFDFDFFGENVYQRPFEIKACSMNEIPHTNVKTIALGRHLDGCRIGFDLGGSDRKCAAVKDGEVVFSEEVEWNPYFESDPQYHIDGINDSLQRALEHLPRIDAIGGSSAGIYVNNEVRVASLFRGVIDNNSPAVATGHSSK